jgi:predicted house-cleaning noncanonical NTP pyrophosphatase (MazG superfamily)
MKLPVIRQFYQNQTPENLEKTLEVLESFSEFRGTSEEDLNVAGELITNICGALEVHAQKVLGSIDK